MKKEQPLRLFNSPAESAVRVAFLLLRGFPESFSLQQLVHLDYLLVHSGDANGPSSLHPALPGRSGEWLVRRQFVQEGLHLLARKGLVGVVTGSEGIGYVAGDRLAPFLKLLRTEYAQSLDERSRWVAARFRKSSEQDLRKFIASELVAWGGEFEFEATDWDEDQ